MQQELNSYHPYANLTISVRGVGQGPEMVK